MLLGQGGRLDAAANTWRVVLFRRTASVVSSSLARTSINVVVLPASTVFHHSFMEASGRRPDQTSFLMFLPEQQLGKC